jgi:RNA polymerase sigma factor (sigma-70 family)
MLGPWTCARCGKVNEDTTLCECGMSMARTIYNELIIKRLFIDTGPSGHTNFEILEKYAFGYAKKRGIPMDLVDDALGKAMERIVENIGKYDVKRGINFRTWAISIVKNEIRTAVRNDLYKNEKIKVFIDQVTEDGSLVVEAIEGDRLGPEDLIDLGERETKRRIATSVLGTFEDYIEGRLSQISVYQKALEIFCGSNSGNEWGWISDLSSATGISRQTIHARIEKAAGIWQRLAKEM